MSTNITYRVIDFLTELQKDPILILIIFILFSTFAILIIKSSKSSFLFKILSSIFITREDSSETTEILKLKSDISKLDQKINSLSTLIDKNELALLKNEVTENIKNDLNQVTSQEISARLEEIFSNEKILSAIVQERVNTLVNDYLDNPFNLTKTIELFRESSKEKNKFELISFIAQQKKSATTTKNVVTNLFILMNILLIGFYVTVGKSAEEKTLLTIALTHVGLSAFMVYIFKASNNRISSLLSVIEDMNKSSQIDQILQGLSKKQNFSQADVEIIKIAMINRSEREKTALHPYEMVFKGVTNSSIQFKGGKIDIDKSASKQ